MTTTILMCESNMKGHKLEELAAVLINEMVDKTTRLNAKQEIDLEMIHNNMEIIQLLSQIREIQIQSMLLSAQRVKSVDIEPEV